VSKWFKDVSKANYSKFGEDIDLS